MDLNRERPNPTCAVGHRYWRLVRSGRVGRRVIQQTLTQLCEQLLPAGKEQVPWEKMAAVLVVTLDGFPLGYEVFPGNTHDSRTLQAIVATMEARRVVSGR
jgi:hypothetical protein